MTSVTEGAETRNSIVERLIGDTGEPDHIIKAARSLGLRALPAIRQSLNEQVSYPIAIDMEQVELARMAEARRSDVENDALVVAASATSPDALMLIADSDAIALLVSALFGGDPDTPVSPIERDLTSIDWAAFEADYSVIRGHISRVVPGCEDYDAKVRTRDGFILPNGPRDSRTFDTSTGKARFTANSMEVIRVPQGRLLLQTLRSHDQFNTTIYGRSDRYRGVHKGRYVVFVNPDDIHEHGLVDGQNVDIYSEWPGEPDRVLRGMRVVSYPTARGCAAAYFPEANVLVPLNSTSRGSNTPVSKAVVVRLEPTHD
jgi:hypothetical protein